MTAASVLCGTVFVMLVPQPASSPAQLKLATAFVPPDLLEVRLLAHGKDPVLLTQRLAISSYLQIEIRDEKGRPVPYRGPISKAARPTQSEFRLLPPNHFFGRQLSLRSPLTFGLSAGRSYVVLVTYSNTDWSDWLSAAERRLLVQRLGNFGAFSGTIAAEPFGVTVSANVPAGSAGHRADPGKR